MSLMPVVLWTDLLIYILLGCVLAFALYARSKEHLRAPWRQVIRSKAGMASLVVLLVYLIIGLLDSFHYRPQIENPQNIGKAHYSSEVLSVFDYLATPLRERDEKTYSAPFATHLFSKETVEQPDGTSLRIFPRLRFGGAHLANPAKYRTADIAMILFYSSLKAGALWILLIAMVSLMLARKGKIGVGDVLENITCDQYAIPWRTILTTTGILLVVVWASADLSLKYHIFGTDKVGQDVFYQTLKSIRTGLVIGTLTTLIMLPFAVLLGISAGYFRGWVDDVIQYLYTTLNSIPGVLLIAAAVLMLQVYMSNNPDMFETSVERADLRLLFLCIILGITSWTGLCRLLRGETLKLRELDYIQAATAFGVKHSKIIGRHILPNVMHIVLIAVVLDFSGLVLAEAVLSYVGVGVDPTMNSWGNMINSARLEMAREPMVWWSLAAAFIFMFTLVLAANLFSDAVRDAFDPRLRQTLETDQ